MKIFFKRAVLGVLALWLAWGAGVAFFCCPFSGWSLGLYIFMAASMIVFRRRSRLLPIPGLVALAAAATAYFLAIPATNDRDWQAPWAQMPRATINGDMSTVENIRDFHYRSETDYDARYITQSYNLAELRTLDLGVCRWDGMEAVAHTMLSFGFDDGRFLAVSAETRLDKSDVQGSLPGLFKRFELLYIFATEADLFGLRTNYRHEDLCLYRLNLSPAQIRAALETLVERANRLRVKPEFYNTLTHNCTTSLLPVLHAASPSVRYSLAATFNGFADRRGFRQGYLAHRPGETFPELKKRSLIPYDTARDRPENYSQAIRRVIGMAP